jgi:PucR C-terminal helix-turn-helix domain/Purine catabolism regulatory protein-like family/GGDEF-like domain
MQLRDVLDQGGPGLALLTGEEHLDRPVRRVYTTDLLDPRRYLAGGEVVLSGLMWRRTAADSEAFVAALAQARVTALGAGEAAYGSVPPDLVDACRRHRVPLFAIPVQVSFRAITEAITDRHRSLVAAMAGGARLADLLPRAAADLRASCWVLSATGRLIAGTGPLPADLTAAHPPGGTYSRHPAGTRHPAGGPPRLDAWLVACSPPQPDESVAELVTLVALARAQHDEGVRVERRLTAELVRLLGGAATDADVAAGLRACGLSPDGTFLVVVARFDGAGGAVLDELVRPVAADAAVADVDGEAMAVLPLDGDLDGDLDRDLDRTAGALGAIREGVRSLEPVLGGARLAVGVSGPAAGAAALPAAVREARHAREYAAAEAGPATVVHAGELASHLLLLAGLPAATRRSFHGRLLGPLAEYDRTHAADLVRTLDTFLDCSGSWTQSAARLHVHVNTLRYRIGRIEQLTGRDLSRFADRVDLYLALRLQRESSPPVGWTDPRKDG